MSGSNKNQPESSWWKRIVLLVFQSPEEFEKWIKALENLLVRIFGLAFLVCSPWPLVHYAAYDNPKVLLISPVLLLLFFFTQLDRGPAETSPRAPETLPRGRRSRLSSTWLRFAFVIISLALASLGKEDVRTAVKNYIEWVMNDSNEASHSTDVPKRPAPSPKPVRGRITVPAPFPAQPNQPAGNDRPSREKFLKDRSKLTQPTLKDGATSSETPQQKKSPVHPSSRQQVQALNPPLPADK